MKYPPGTRFTYKWPDLSNITWEIVRMDDIGFEAMSYYHGKPTGGGYYPLSDPLITEPDNYIIEFPKASTFDSLYHKLL